MARFARVIVPGIPYHVTHRGNRREPVFFSDDQREAYRHWLRHYAGEYGLEIWAYCLMSNHIHLLAVPEREDSLALAIGRAHMRHSRRVNHEQGWSGHLWANRFFSTALDEEHLWHAVKYVELNPVRARMCVRAEDWKWSSARAHAMGAKDELLSPKRPFPASDRVGDWPAWLMQGLSDEQLNRIRQNTRTGRPSGDESFIEKLERLLNRLLRPLKRGPKARQDEENQLIK